MALRESKQLYKILIIDDSKPLRETTADILSSFGYTIYQASTALEGMALYEVQLIDLVILDVNMPDIDGAQLYRDLLLLDPEVNVIVYSTDPYTAVAERFSPLTIPYFLHKPVDLTDLFETVELTLKGPELLHNDFRQRKSILTF